MSFFSDIQQHIYDRLKDATALDGLDYFASVDVIQEDQGDVLTAINKAIAGLGLVVVIHLADADCDKPNVPGPYLDSVRTAIDVAENVTLNRTGDSYKTINQVVEHVLLYLHHYKPDDVNEVFICDREAVRTVDPPQGTTVARRILITTSGGIELSS